MPVGTHSAIYTPGPGFQHKEHDFVTSLDNLSFQGRWPAKKGKNTHINIPGTVNCVDGLSKVEGIIEGEDCLLPDRQYNSSSLSVEGGWHSLQDLKWSCGEDSPQLS